MTRREPAEESGFLTELFHRFVDAHDGGRSVDREELLSEAEERGGPDGRERLRLRIRRFEDFERSATELEEDDAVPRSLGEYPVHAVIARGGMSTVYRSTDPRLERPVALKVMNTTLDADGEERALILKEARSLARMDQRGVVRVHNVGTADGRDFLVMELLPGPSLAEVIAELRRLREGSGDVTGDEGSETTRLAARLEPLSARLRCLASVAEALAACHDRGLLHRDVKPANVLFDDEGEPVLIDFGLVHEVDRDEAEGLVTRQLVTTRGYSAPEQLETRQTGADPRSDQFSFAVLAYELLTLHHPFLVAGRIDLAANERAELAPPRRFEPALSRDVERILLHALERDPEHRYPDLHALTADLRAVLEHRAISVAEPSLRDVLALWRRRHARRIRLGLAAGLVLLVGALSLHVLSLARSRATLLGELESMPFDELGTAQEIEGAGLGIEEHLGLLANWRESSVLAALFPDQEEPSRSAVERWWRRARVVLDEERERADREGRNLQYGAWVAVVDVASRICPGGTCEGLEDLALRGRVVFPTDLPRERLQLLQQGMILVGKRGYGIHFAEIPLTDRLREGYYRLRLLDATGTRVEREMDFVHRGFWAPPLSLELREPHPELLDAVLVPATTAAALAYKGNSQFEVGPLVTVPPFRISDVVLVGDFVALCQELDVDCHSSLAKIPKLGLADDAPAPVSIVDAHAFAGALGGRIPTACEIEVALEAGLVEPPPPGALGELACDSGANTFEDPHRTIILLPGKDIGADRVEGLAGKASSMEVPIPDEVFYIPPGPGFRGYAVFRVAFTAGSPARQGLAR